MNRAIPTRTGAALSTILLLAGSVALAAAPKSDADFLTDAMKGDNSEIKLGQLAEGKGASASVRKFGSMLVTDHTRAKLEVANAASAYGVTPTDDAMPEALTEYTKLSGMSGAAFDSEFVRYMVADHQQDIAEFEAQAGGNDKTNTLAKQQLPTLRKHLQMAQALEK